MGETVGRQLDKDQEETSKQGQSGMNRSEKGKVRYREEEELREVSDLVGKGAEQVLVELKMLKGHQGSDGRREHLKLILAKLKKMRRKGSDEKERTSSRFRKARPPIWEPRPERTLPRS